MSAQKITVSLSDGLYERLQAVKGEFNMSRVCQDAIEHAVWREEDRKKHYDSLEQKKAAAIKRLAAEKEEYNKQYEEEGRKEGYESATDMTYEQLLSVAVEEDYSAINEMVEQDKYGEHLYRRNDKTFNEEAYTDGWVKGVKEFYEEIQDSE